MLLDTFVTVFQADTSKLDDGLRRSDKSADDLIDSLKKTDDQASKTGSAFAGFASKALGALTAAVSVGSLITNAVVRAQEVTNLANTADALGLAVEELDAFGRAAQAAGGDAQGARDSLVDMAETIGEALQDVESQRAKTLTGLGVSLRDVKGNAIDAVEGILRLADSVQNLSREEAVFRIKELGITDNKTVELVLRGRKELERMLAVQKEQGVVTKEAAENARKFTESTNALRGAWEGASTNFMSAVLPVLTTVVEWLTKVVEWAGKHSDFITGFFIAIATVITAIYLPAMISAAAATLAATWPIIAIAAVITALAAAFALAYDDIMNFIEGNDSFIGQVFEKYPIVKDVVFAVIDAFKLMGTALGAVFSFLVDSWKATFDFIMKGVDLVKEGLLSAAEFFGFGSEDNAGGARGAASRFGVVDGNAQLASAAASPLNSVTSNAITNSNSAVSRSNNVEIGQLNVQTQATDANGVASGIGGALNQQIADMDDEFSSGVER
jgi:hypothetical protein